ncbi:HU family DNA-binding protein [Marinifilum sp. D714]|nr:HU family DNA-binding protein [Marinifilum sp. D714]
MKQVVEFIASRTGLNKGQIQMVLAELADTVIFFNKQGQGVKLEGLGTYLPEIDTEGEISVSHRLDRYIKSALNVEGGFTGNIENKTNIGKSKEEFIAMWNEAHPDDPISLN